MKNYLIGALALGLALSTLGVSSAYAEPVPTTAHFRTVQPQSFSTEEIQRFGLDADAAARAESLQNQGYRILALTPAEAEAYRAGDYSQQTWIFVGVAVLVILAVAA
jgi:hypothetical protein